MRRRRGRADPAPPPACRHVADRVRSRGRRRRHRQPRRDDKRQTPRGPPSSSHCRGRTHTSELGTRAMRRGSISSHTASPVSYTVCGAALTRRRSSAAAGRTTYSQYSPRYALSAMRPSTHQAPFASAGAARCRTMFCGRTEKLTGPFSRPATSGSRSARAVKPGKRDRPGVRRAVEEIGAPDEPRDEACPRPIVQRHRIVDLLDPAVVHHHDAVRRHHRLGLVVRHVHGGDAERIVQATDLRAHLLAQVGVQVGQRLVQQQHLGLDHDRPRQRHALLLPAGQFRRIAVLQMAKLHHVQDAIEPAA